MQTDSDFKHNSSLNNIVEPSEPQLFSEHIQTTNALGMFIKPLIFAGIDGCINTLTIITSCMALNLSIEKIQFYCFVIIISDGICMGLGDYLSTKEEINVTRSKEEQAQYQIQQNLEDEKKLLIHIYEKKDFSHENAARIIELYSTNQQAFLNIKMLEQYKLVKIDSSIAIKNGVASFISFLVCGFLPAMPYMMSEGAFQYWQNWNHQTGVVLSLAAIQLFSLGLAKGALIGVSKCNSAFKTLLIGGIIAAASYFIIIYLSDKY